MKKILFTFLGLFTLFLINNTNVYASTLSLSQQNLHLSQDEYYDVSFYVNDELNNVTSLYCSQIWITRTFYDSTDGHLIKEYLIWYYDDIDWAWAYSDDLKFTFPYFREVFVKYENGVYSITHDYTCKSSSHSTWSYDLKEFDIDNYGTTRYSYHFAFSNGPVYVYDNMYSDNLVFFYSPDFNFDGYTSMNTLIDGAEDNKTEYENDYNESLAWYERLWNSIKSIDNYIYNLFKTINDFFDTLIVDIFNAIIDLPGNIWNFLKQLPDMIWDKFTALGNLISDCFKALFIPSDEFFTNWFDKVDNMMSAQFGFLYSSFALIIDFLQSFYSLEATNAIINIPDIHEPITGGIIIESTSINLTSIVDSNSTLSLLYDVYQTFIFAWVAFALINLGRKTFLNI